ncbi:Uncharacterised protein [Zhongshania aliphaticivorans]|uniref:CENP-V/GFA domain-containing protein n=1 Tax=Zhongshania aliphaticivorans TaxID=1470434 RepID=A0A5S9PIW8_9GAMM|nr:hypothetical protein [Zhongshania aliphaticivorans]CAA0103991.1 Uncharacterised protein [Zhongshania aliphaticivorans]CAA0104137.1 Uncharacterised protein [Zhongshania aliphaticivorans]
MKEVREKLKCQCGQVSFSVSGKPIISAECLCSDCQIAGAEIQKRAGAPLILDRNGATRFVLFRKDKVEFLSGQEKLKSYYINDDLSTRRIIASCCNTPVFLEFTKGHWLSMYGNLWSKDEIPPLEIRTMTRSRPKGVVLPNDVPNPKTHNFSFYIKLLSAWAAMRFSAPELDFIAGKIDD